MVENGNSTVMSWDSLKRSLRRIWNALIPPSAFSSTAPSKTATIPSTSMKDEEVTLASNESKFNDPSTIIAQESRTTKTENDFEEAVLHLMYHDYTQQKVRLFLDMPTNDLPSDQRTLLSQVPHLHQLESWDCGLACLIMVIRWIQAEAEGFELHPASFGTDMRNASLHTDDELLLRQSLQASIGTESIWTADLVLQIHSMLFREEDKLRYLFCSKTFQVDPEYQKVGYYSAAFGSDEERVTGIFKQLQAKSSTQQHILCTPNGLPLSRVLQIVGHRHCIAIVLVDNAELHRSYLNKTGETFYMGHYIILCGISRDPNHVQAAHALDGKYGIREGFCLVVSNPGQHQPYRSFLTPARFERAWRSRGTDEDIIFISRNTTRALLKDDAPTKGTI